GRAQNHIDIYARELLVPDLPPAKDPGPLAVPYGRGTLAEMAYWLGRFVDRRVVLGKVEGAPEQVSWTAHPPGLFWPGATPEEWEATHDFDSVLKHVTEQTGLTVREETHRVRVLVVERKPRQNPKPAPQAPDGGAPNPDWLDDPLYRASQALVGWWPA